MRVAYGQKITGSDRKRFYYMCTLKHNSSGTRCNNKNVNGIELDDMVIAKLKEATIDKSLLLDKIEEYKKSLTPSNTADKITELDKSISTNNLMIENLTTNISLTTDAEILNILFDKIKTLKEKNKSYASNKEQLLSSTNDIQSMIDFCDKLLLSLLHLHNTIDKLSLLEKNFL